MKQTVGLILFACLALSACKNKAVKNNSDAEDNQEKTSTTYVKTGSVERLSDVMDAIISPGEVPEIIAEGFDWSEGPLWLPEEKVLIFSDIPMNSIFQWSEKEGLKLYLKPSGYTDTKARGGETGSNGLLLDNKGRLVLCQHGDRRMAYMDAPLDQAESKFVTLIDNWQGKKFNSPNDAVFSSKGDLYFTDPAYGMEFKYDDPKREMDFTAVFRLSAEGEMTLITDKMSAPNGIGLTPDESKLIVANSGGGENSYWMEFSIMQDGTLDDGKYYYMTTEAERTERGGPDGLVIRDDGVMFATGPGGVWIFSAEGEHLGTVKTGQATSNCTIGDGGRYLFITADMYLMRIRLK